MIKKTRRTKATKAKDGNFPSLQSCVTKNPSQFIFPKCFEEDVCGSMYTVIKGLCAKRYMKKAMLTTQKGHD